MNKKTKKQLPKLSSDKQAENFITSSDLTEYDLSAVKAHHFEFEPKLRPISLRLPESLYRVVQEQAKKEGIKTQRFIRRALEEAVN